MDKINKQTVTVNGLCQLILCFDLQSTSESTKGHKSCALQMVLGSTNLTVKVLPKELRTCFTIKIKNLKIGA